MGLDQHYQAMPPDCELLRRSRFDPEFGSYLSSFSYFSDHIPEEMQRVNAGSTKFDFLAEMLALMADHPGIEDRFLDFGRRWDMLHFLLSAERRSEAIDEPDWAYRAIHGGEILHPEVQSGIGITIKYLTPAEVSDIWERLVLLDTDEVGARWNQERMKEAAVYKYNQMRECDWFEDFERFTEFYFKAMAHDEGVIITCN